MLAYVPLGYKAVWVAGVVDEAGNAALLCRIEVLVALQHHKVEVRYPLVVIALHSLAEVVFLNYFADVLVDEGVCGDKGLGAQAKALFLCLDDVDVCILLALKTLILAVLTTSAIFCYAFDLGEAIDAAAFVCTGAGDVVAAYEERASTRSATDARRYALFDVQPPLTGPIVALAYQTPLMAFASAYMLVGIPVVCQPGESAQGLVICLR